MKPRLIAVHLLNDRSGSPLVFSQALQVLQPQFEIALFTATPSGEGFLSNLEGIRQYPVFYRWSSNKLITLFYFLLSQALLFARVLFFLRSTDTVYVNTLLPFGAALAGYFRRCKVVYHIHEVSLKPALLKKFLYTVANRTATKAIFVSKYTASCYHFSRPATSVVYNALPAAFRKEAAHVSLPHPEAPFTVLMACSLKAYKGVDHFINIARALPAMRFLLVLNASEKEIAQKIRQSQPPANCILYPTSKHIIAFYEQAHVVMNLSRPDGWIETFGMTVLEAMYCGRPVIVPPVGGVRELVRHDREGFRIDSREEHKVIEHLELLHNDEELYRRMSEAAYKRAATFGAATFAEQIRFQFYHEHPDEKKTGQAMAAPKRGRNISGKVIVG